MQSKITLLGMYNFDNSLFDNLNFPAGIDRDLAIKRILNKSEEFEVLYSDFDYLKDRIGIWGEIWERTFSKWFEALNIKYDPLNNYDRHEEFTDLKNTATVSNSNTVTGSHSNSDVQNKVSAYDEVQYSDREEEIGTAASSQYGSGGSKANINDLSKHDAHLYGNIGVTTSQEMLKAELEVATWSMYEHIADIFIDEFCILVY